METAVQGKFYTLVVDEVEHRVEQATITGGEIMDLAGIPREVGLIFIDENGTQRPFGADEVFTFEGPGRRFKRRPTFIRG